MKNLIGLFILVGSLTACSSASMKPTNASGRNPASACVNGEYAYLDFRKDLVLPDAKEVVLLGDVAPNSKRRLACNFLNQSGKKLSFKKDDRLTVAAFEKRFDQLLLSKDPVLQVSCSEEGIDALNESIDWGSDRFVAITRAMHGQIGVQTLGSCVPDDKASK